MSVEQLHPCGTDETPDAPYRTNPLPWGGRLELARQDLAAVVPMGLSQRYADGDDYAALLISAVESKRELAGFPLSEVGTRTCVRLAESVAARQARALASASAVAAHGPVRHRLFASACLAASAAARLAAVRRCGAEA